MKISVCMYYDKDYCAHVFPQIIVFYFVKNVVMCIMNIREYSVYNENLCLWY